MKTYLNKRWFRAGLACLVLTVSAGAGYGQTTNYPFTFNNIAGVTNYWGTQQSGGITGFTNDAPSGGHSTGCLLFSGPAGTADIGIETTHGVGITNYSGYTNFQFDVKIEPPQFGGISGFDMWFGFAGGTVEVITNFSVVSTNGGWQHIIMPVALIDGGNSSDLSDLETFTFQVYDGNYGSTNMELGMDNFMFTSGSGGSTNTVTPVFSGLTSHTNTYGASSVTLTGTVSTNGQYLPNGTAVTVTINGSGQGTTIDDSTGDFSINYTSTGLLVSGSPYTVTYTSAAATGFNAATNTSTALTIKPLPVVLTGTEVYNGTTNASASILTVSNLVGSDSVTLSGSVGLAGSGVGAEAITSFGSLTLGGSAAGNYTLTGASGTVTITAAPVTPVFSGLSSHTITYGASGVTLTGTVSTNGQYLPNGTAVKVTINGSGQGTTIDDSTGDFSINYTTASLSVSGSPYTVTYTSAAASGFNAATNTGTTLTVNRATPVINTAPTASAITFGQTLASSTLSGGSASTAGSFAFTTPTIAPNVGTTNVSVTFTPTDTTDYNTATTTVTVTVNPASSQVTTYIYTFSVANDIRNWGPYASGSGGATASFNASDAPTNGTGPSTGCLVWTELFTSSATAGGIAATNSGTNSTLTYLNVTNCTAFEFDLKIPTNSLLDSSSKLTQFQPILLYGPGGSEYAYSGAEIDLTRQSTNNGWQHFIITNSYLGGSANWTQIKGVVFHSQYDGGFASNNTTNTLVEFANVKFTGPGSGSTNTVTPVFSGLSSHTIPSGTTNVTLTGTVSTNGQYLPQGTAVTVTINGSGQGTTIDDSTGDFSINYNTTGFATNVYTVTYTSAATTGFNAATNTGTTLTITAQSAVTPQFSGLSSPTTTYGTANVSLSGTVSTNGQYLPQGSTVTATVNGNAQNTTIDDSTGDFDFGYDAVGIPASGTPYTVHYTSAAASGFNPATNTSTTMTINKLAVVLSGSMVANGTTTVPASDLSVANLVSGDNLTLSGSVQIAGTNVGPESITSFSGLTLGGSSAANYTLTGASGTVTITSGSGSTNAIPGTFFGLHAMGYGTSPYPVPYQPWGLIRLWDHWGNGDLTWAGLEPSQGTFTWSALDAAVDAVTNSNPAIIYCFGNGPSWVGGTAPTNIAAWDTFITNFVTRYHTKIKYLETWNEAAPGEGFYTGTTAMLVQLEHDLYFITKSIDPTVTVFTPDATGGWASVSNFFVGYFAAGGTNCDAVTFHGYCSEAGVANVICYPEEMIGVVNGLKTVMTNYGQGSKPIYCTEGDWGTEGSGENQPTTNDAVAFFAREYLLLSSMGISSYAWYDWENNNGYWQWGEMWDSTYGLDAAGVAYSNLDTWMVGATISQPYAESGSVFTMGFTRPGGYQALAVWNTNRSSGSSFTVPSGYIQYRDLAGNLTSISGTNVTIGIEPILLENMNP